MITLWDYLAVVFGLYFSNINFCLGRCPEAGAHDGVRDAWFFRKARLHASHRGKYGKDGMRKRGDIPACGARARCGLLLLAGLLCLAGYVLAGRGADVPLSGSRSGASASSAGGAEELHDKAIQGDAAGGGTLLYPSLGQRVAGYCRQMAEAAGRDPGVETACLRDEQFAVFELSDIDQPIPKKTVGSCRAIADAQGGSYRVMLRCVKEALSAGGGL
jgi:hypothetical protein